MKNMHIPSGRTGWRRFRDRDEAGRLLAIELARVVRPPAVVAAIPRGGVSVALPIAEQLHVPLAVVYARKLTAHVAPELAFGTVDEDGEAIIDATTAVMLGLTAADIEAAKARVEAEIVRRTALYRMPPAARLLRGAALVLVDDGLATGLTMRAAIAYARRHGAGDVIVAVPCAAAAAAQGLANEAVRVVALVVDEAFLAVGAYYLDFFPVSDRDVLGMLDRARQEGALPDPPPLPA